MINEFVDRLSLGKTYILKAHFDTYNMIYIVSRNMEQQNAGDGVVLISSRTNQGWSLKEGFDVIGVYKKPTPELYLGELDVNNIVIKKTQMVSLDAIHPTEGECWRSAANHVLFAFNAPGLPGRKLALANFQSGLWSTKPPADRSISNIKLDIAVSPKNIQRIEIKRYL